MKKILFLLGLVAIISCNQSSKKEVKESSGGKYTIVEKKESNGYVELVIVVENEISEENLRKLMKDAAYQNIGNSKGINVDVFGDEKYVGLAGNTHGRYGLDKTENGVEERQDNYFKSKKTRPSEVAVNIAVDYMKLYERDREKANKELANASDSEKLKYYYKHLNELSEKYKMSEEEIRGKMDEFDNYMYEDVVPD